MNYTPVVIEHQHKVLQVADEKANALSNPHILLFLSWTGIQNKPFMLLFQILYVRCQLQFI